jgi:polyisoprenoid-binding protein YceI
MCTAKNITKIVLSFLFLLTFYTQEIYSQEFTLNNETSQLIVSGTSSLHDWHVDAEQQKGKIVLELSKQLKIEKLTLEVISKSLKSGKGSMDKNTYKALKTDEFKSITFKFTELKEATALDNGNYKVKTSGNLTVAGVTKNISLDFNLHVASDKVTLKGEKTFNMTDYGIDPPKALLGTITTGDEITIKFNTVLNK